MELPDGVGRDPGTIRLPRWGRVVAVDEAVAWQVVDNVSEAVVAVEGESMRPVTHVVITETPSGEWAIGGTPMTAEDVRAKRAAG